MGKYWLACDAETTGFDAETNSIVEIAFVDQRGDYTTSLVKPNHKIGYGAMATHHITEEMVANELDLTKALEAQSMDPLSIQEWWQGEEVETILVFHNAEFDRAFLPPHLQELRYVCTWRCAVAMFPNAESHSNGALWYELGLNHQMPEEAGRMPHRALFDAIMTGDLMHYMIKHVAQNENIADPLEHLIWLTQQPILLTTCRFGKHRGQLWSEVPVDYLQWCLRQDMDADVKFTCKHWMEEHKRG